MPHMTRAQSAALDQLVQTPGSAEALFEQAVRTVHGTLGAEPGDLRGVLRDLIDQRSGRALAPEHVVSAASVVPVTLPAMRPPVVIPPGAVVVLLGAPGAGKSTFAAAHFAPTQILSLDALRAAVSDDAANQAVTGDAVGLMHQLLESRLRHQRTTVVDATHVSQGAREGVATRADRAGALRIALVVDATREECQSRNAARDRVVPAHRVDAMYDSFEQSVVELETEGFAAIHRVRLDETQVVQAVAPLRHPDVPVVSATGFDLIGDVHGCHDELLDLLGAAGYTLALEHETGTVVQAWHTDPHRKLAFVGDLVDRGPNALACVRSVQTLVGLGKAVCVMGNHDNKAARAMRPGSTVQRTHGLAETLAQFEAELGVETPAWESVRTFLRDLPPYALLETPGAPTVVLSHAGMDLSQVGQAPKAVQARCLYGAVVGTPAAGPPQRTHEWVQGWTDPSLVAVYGHTPQAEATFRGHTINLDTGCAFGDTLTALQWPERTVVQVPAQRAYAPRYVAAVDAVVSSVADVPGAPVVLTPLPVTVSAPRPTPRTARRVL